eukprot:131753-Pyramimonas_sp.AAC.1
MLGVIHRAVLGHGPALFSSFFCPSGPPPRSPRRRARHLVDPLQLRAPDFARRSLLGSVGVCNLLPDSAAAAQSVHALLTDMADSYPDWTNTLSWRAPFANHPLRRHRD